MNTTGSGTYQDLARRVLRLKIDGPAQGGEFVARHDGRVVFVRGALTGETVDVDITDDPGRSYCRGEVRDIIDASPDRVEPRCPAAAAGAGCCDWSHITPAAAHTFQARIISDQLQRIGKISEPLPPFSVAPPAGDDTQSGWRTTVRWVTDDDGTLGNRRARSHEVVTTPCIQGDPRLYEAAAAADIAPNREVLAVLDDTDQVHVAVRKIVTPPESGGKSTRDRQRRSAARRRANQFRAGRWSTVTDNGPVIRTVGDTRWELPIDAFWQAHRSAPEHYSAVVCDAASTISPTRVWDLYGGAGVLAAAARQVAPNAELTVVEAAGQALGAAEQALGSAGVRLVNAPVDRFLADYDSETAGADLDPAELVIIDPPRAGAGIAVMSALSTIGARRVVHLGCDPAAMARDVGVLVAAGWHLSQLGGVAAFPGTHHVEGVAVLDAPDLHANSLAKVVD